MNDRHIEKQHVTVSDCEKLGQELLNEIYQLSEERVRAESSPRNQAVVQAAMTLKYSLETFLLIASLNGK